MKPRLQRRCTSSFIVCLALLLWPVAPAKGGAPPLASPSGDLLVVTVDLPVLFAFHPAMRTFDHHAGKFVSLAPVRASSGGLQTWNEMSEQRKAITDLEASMTVQLERVNVEMAANSRPPDPRARSAPPRPGRSTKSTSRWLRSTGDS